MSRRSYYDHDDSDERSRSVDRDYERRHKDDYEDYEDDYYQQKKPKTEKEAERVMERAKDKKFWNCDDVDNYNSLKGAVDLMFNKIPGNIYGVQYQENQNGTRLTIVCETCDKTLSSYDPFLSHENGKNHKKARQQKLTPPDPNLKAKIKNRRINTPKNIFFEDTLEDDIDCSKRTTIGVHFVYKETLYKDECFTCTLCINSSKCERISRKKMLSHITGESHMRNYLEVKHGFNRKQDLGLEEEAKHIEELEGKIHHKIVDFTNQLEEKPSKRDIKREKKESSSSSDSDSSSSHSSSSRRRRKIKRSPNSRRYSPSPTRKFKRSPSSRRYSPSPSRRIKRSPSSRRLSPSPSRSNRSRRSKSHSPVSYKARGGSPAPSLLPPQHQVASVASVSCEVAHSELGGKTIQDLCKYVEAEETKDECLNTISEDLDMQGLIIHALFVLNSKVDEYYKDNGLLFNDGISVGSLSEKSEDMHNYICQLKALERDPEE